MPYTSGREEHEHVVHEVAVAAIVCVFMDESRIHMHTKEKEEKEEEEEEEEERGKEGERKRGKVGDRGGGGEGGRDMLTSVAALIP